VLNEQDGSGEFVVHPDVTDRAFAYIDANGGEFEGQLLYFDGSGVIFYQDKALREFASLNSEGRCADRVARLLANPDVPVPKKPTMTATVKALLASSERPVGRSIESGFCLWAQNPHLIARLRESAEITRASLASVVTAVAQQWPGGPIADSLLLLDELATLDVINQHCSSLQYPLVQTYDGDTSDPGNEVDVALILVIVRALFEASIISSAALSQWEYIHTGFGEYETAISQLESIVAQVSVVSSQ